MPMLLHARTRAQRKTEPLTMNQDVCSRGGSVGGGLGVVGGGGREEGDEGRSEEEIWGRQKS